MPGNSGIEISAAYTAPYESANEKSFQSNPWAHPILLQPNDRLINNRLQPGVLAAATNRNGFNRFPRRGLARIFHICWVAQATRLCYPFPARRL
jgi:hypothetical protein